MTTHNDSGLVRRPRAMRLMAGVGCLSLLVLAACGTGGGSGGTGGSGSGGSGTPAKVARGGVYRTAVSSFGLSDNMDPVGEAQIGFAFSVYDAMLRTLVTFRHVNGSAGTQIVPDLATSV
ncbi:MAG: hypothetical protein ACRDNZ_11595, partial [Streptosporangiaceae bacterium]